MTLTEVQRKAGRAFRDACQARLAPTELVVPAWIRHYRHECEARNRLSWTMNLVEHYITSPEYWVCYCGEFAPGPTASFPHDDCQGGKVIAAAGLLCFYWKQGECRRCGLTARSDGQVWLAADRPPLMGAIVEEFHA